MAQRRPQVRGVLMMPRCFKCDQPNGPFRPKVIGVHNKTCEKCGDEFHILIKLNEDGTVSRTARPGHG